MKTIKDLKNYVKHNSRIVLKDCIDTSFFNYSEWAIIQDMKKQVKKKSKAIYKEFRDILDNDNLPLIVGNYGVTGRLRIEKDNIHYVAGQDARMEIHNHLRAYLETNYK
tara:strand:+ start:362 stop:688 length:327 start_codon:yes stop_codon:yes gene_type:complete